MFKLLRYRLMCGYDWLMRLNRCLEWHVKKTYIWPFTGTADCFYEAVQRLTENNLTDND
jgi:hypothetical protein